MNGQGKLPEEFEKVVSEITDSAEEFFATSEPFLKLRRAKLELDSHKQHLDLRDKFANWTIGIVTGWIVGLGASFFSLAVYRGTSGKELFSDWILVTLLGASTATIIGLPLVIIKGLFPPNNKNDKNDETRSPSTK